MFLKKSILKLKKFLFPFKWVLIMFKIISTGSLLKIFFYAANENLISIGIRSLNGNKIYIRGNSKTDRKVLKYVYFDQYHLPQSVLSEKSVIVDLGSNIGLTLRHFAFLYPASKIFGYEMDKKNFEICSDNIKGMDNISLQNKAVWFQNTTVYYNVHSNSDAYAAGLPKSILNSGTVETSTIEKIISDNKLEVIDYLKMDIEGAEIQILNSDLSWTNIVQNMNIEIHNRQFIDVAMDMLSKRGFICSRHPKHKFSIFARRNR